MIIGTGLSNRSKYIPNISPMISITATTIIYKFSNGYYFCLLYLVPLLWIFLHEAGLGVAVIIMLLFFVILNFLIIIFKS